MSFEIAFTKDAFADAARYVDFIRHDQQSPVSAEKWSSGLLDAIATLKELPSRFAVIPEAKELGFPYRSFVYHSHRVVYAIHEQDQTVVIHHIWHNSRDNLVIPGDM